MMSSSGFLVEANLTEGDANARLSLDFAHDAVVFDVSDCLEHVATLQDYASLYMPALHNLDTAFSVDVDRQSISIALISQDDAINLDTASEIYDEDEDDDTDEDEDSDDEDDEDAAAKSRSAEHERLKVLTTPEMHKTAARIFSSLGDSADMAAYVGFLRDFDGLLSRYGGVAAKSRMPLDEEETAFNTDIAALSDFFLEEAKKRGKKKGYSDGRSGLLSALMKGLSGESGEKVQSAWDGLKVEAFKESMSNVVATAAGILSEELEKRGPSEEETTEEGASGAIPLVAMVRLINATDLHSWAKEQGFTHMLEPDDMHVTVAYSKEPIDTTGMPPMEKVIVQGEGSSERSVNYLGDNKALVLHLGPEESKPLADRWEEYRTVGASWDYDGYKPHITLSYKENLTEEQLKTIKPFTGPLHFGEEKVEELKKQEDGTPGFDVTKIPHVKL
jgi:hypothetical protein